MKPTTIIITSLRVNTNTHRNIKTNANTDGSSRMEFVSVRTGAELRLMDWLKVSRHGFAMACQSEVCHIL